MAPEIIKKNAYGSGVDIWAVGVLAHIILTGIPPFRGNTKVQLKKNIVLLKHDFGGIQSSLSKQAVEFVDMCLNKDLNTRPTAEELLQHAWVKGNTEFPYVERKVAGQISENLA